ncbi:hypothetical protein [Szabonella alba]|uniref:Uncharacterized protein n=1 Tax=Szabonella alba TaxID=2804194 RepID=A0A8K0VAM7_9RHOB|nr:hypothetical protein [Szabonella alba]MBL4915747.1 hypothetical protein [Szabonella alba]
MTHDRHDLTSEGDGADWDAAEWERPDWTPDWSQPDRDAQITDAALTQGELWFRLVFLLFCLGLLAFTLWYRGLPRGVAQLELIAVAGLFFGGAAGGTALRLLRGR